MSRIKKLFETYRQEQRKALIPYITVGDPNKEVTLQLMHTLVAQGADILELGVPFSDPMANGPDIQAAHNRALQNQITLTDCLAIIQEFRQTNQSIPIVLMTYLNPIEGIGYDNFLNRAVQADLDGILVVDMPPEEGEDLLTVMELKQISPIFLIAPTTTDERIEYICQYARGFIYYVSLKGGADAKATLNEEVYTHLQKIRSHTHLPVAVGFGIHDGETAKKMAEYADGIIVGSAYVKLVALHHDNQEALMGAICTLTQELRQALDSVVECI